MGEQQRGWPSPRTPRTMSTIHALAAGLDVGATCHVVAVPRECADQPVRTVRNVSEDLCRLADWLRDVWVTTVAMKSTGVYWIPVVELLEARGFEALLVNARDLKNVPGRKTDVNDAQWLQQLTRFDTAWIVGPERRGRLRQRSNATVNPARHPAPQRASARPAGRIINNTEPVACVPCSTGAIHSVALKR